jgi:heme/copper-type cytochrome/quinol oxidase subunit 3
VVSYLYLWTVSPHAWPSAAQLPAGGRALASAVLLAASSGAIALANRRLASGGRIDAGVVVATLCIVPAFVLDLLGHRDLSPQASAYGAVVYLLLSLEGFFVAIVVAMALFALARQACGRLDRQRRVTFDNARLFWHYTVAQSLVGLVLVHGFGRWAAAP